MTLAEFLRARLTEDEQPCEGAQEYQSCDELSERRRRDIDAKRRIIDEHRDDGHGWCLGCGMNAVEEMRNMDDCPTLLALAAVYADHPDYRDEWRP